MPNPASRLPLTGLLAAAFLLPAASLGAEATPRSGFKLGTTDCKLTLAQDPKHPLALEVKLKDHYKINEALELDIHAPNSPVYVTVLDHGSDPANPHRAHRLYTNKLVAQGGSYHFPEPNTGILQVSGPAGENTFEIIASPAPLSDPEANSKNVNLVKPEENPPVETLNCLVSFRISA